MEVEEGKDDWDAEEGRDRSESSDGREGYDSNGGEGKGSWGGIWLIDNNGAG